MPGNNNNMKDTPISLDPIPLAHDDWQYVKKRSMDEYDAADWAIWGPQRDAYFKENKVDHILRMLECQKDDPSFIYTTNNYYHCLQTATRMVRADCSEEDVVVGLLHDVGFVTCNETHGAFAAALMKPFISERNHWMLLHHAVFQQYHCHDLDGCDRHARDRWKDNPHFAWTAEYRETDDQCTTSPDEELRPLDFRVPMAARLSPTAPKLPS